MMKTGFIIKIPFFKTNCLFVKTNLACTGNRINMNTFQKYNWNYPNKLNIYWYPSLQFLTRTEIRLAFSSVIQIFSKIIALETSNKKKFQALKIRLTE